MLKKSILLTVALFVSAAAWWSLYVHRADAARYACIDATSSAAYAACLEAQ